MYLFISTLEEHDINISMDGKGRFRDNIFIERLWRSVKCGCGYITEYKEVKELRTALGEWFAWYNRERLHQALGYRTPGGVYREGLEGLPHAALCRI